MPKRTLAAPLLTNEEIAQAKKLGSLVRTGEIAPLIGSGFSVRSGLPKWSELVSRIFSAWQDCNGPTEISSISLTVYQYRQVLGKVFRDDLALATFIRGQIGVPKGKGPGTFSELVYGALYGKLDTPPMLRTPSPTSSHRHIVAMFANSGTRIWTTNYDDLLEEAARQTGITARTLDLDRHRSGRGLQIAHLHGFLAPPDRRQNHPDPKASNVILAEDDYHEMTTDLIGWTNREFTRLFDEHRVLIVGASLDDPNLRRVLATLKRKPQPDGSLQHFAIMRRVDHSENFKSVVRTVRARKVCAHDAGTCRKEYWAAHGLEIIDLPDHDSILPFILRVRYESHGDSSGALWADGARSGNTAVDAGRPERRLQARRFLCSAIDLLRDRFKVRDSAEVVELGIFLLQPDRTTLELVFRSQEKAEAPSAVRCFSGDPDKPTGLAGRVFTSGQVVRVSTDDPIFNFGLRSRRDAGATTYQGIVSVPIVDWKNGAIPLGVIYVTTSTTNGDLFNLPLQSDDPEHEPSLDELQIWLNGLALFMIAQFKRQTVPVS